MAIRWSISFCLPVVSILEEFVHFLLGNYYFVLCLRILVFSFSLGEGMLCQHDSLYLAVRAPAPPHSTLLYESAPALRIRTYPT